KIGRERTGDPFRDASQKRGAPHASAKRRETLGRLTLETFALPGDLVGQALVHADARLPAEMPLHPGGVGRREALVAGAGGLLTNDGALPGEAFEFVQHVPDADGLAAADVVSLPWHGLQGLHRRLHAIADVGIAAHLQAIAKNRDWLPAQQGLNEAVIT